MRIILIFLRRMTWLFRKKSCDTALREEIDSHIRSLVDRNIADGVNPEEARFAAERQFGNAAIIHEHARDQYTWVWLDQWWKDAGFAFRALYKGWRFTLTVLGTLIVGIGVVAAVFKLTSGIVLFAQPYPHPEQLFFIGFKDKQSAVNIDRPALLLSTYREQLSVFSEYAAVTRDTTNVVVDGEPITADLLNASADCFQTLGIQPVLGRNFSPEEFHAGTNNVVILTDLFWRQHFHSNPDVLGSKILVDQQICVVVGVFRPSQPFPDAFGGDIYRPLVIKPDPSQPLSPTMYIIGRLKPGVSLAQANAALASVKLSNLPPWAATFLSDQQPTLFNLTDLSRPETYWVMLIAALLLYTIACLNVTNLALVRIIGRRRELSIRFALGGTRWQILRLLTIESSYLTCTACLAVTVAVRWIFPPLFALIENNDAMRYASLWDLRTLVCVWGLGLLANVVVLLVPAFRLFNADINKVLKEGGAALGSSPRMKRLRNALVVFQTALAVVLLAGTGLMVSSFEKMHRVNLGFDPRGIVKVQIAFPHEYNPESEEKLQLFERLKQRLASIPGVTGAAVGQNTLLEGGFWGTAQVLMPDGTYKPVAGNFVAPDFLQLAGVTLKKGRWLSGRRGENEVLINEEFAKNRFGQEDPVGKSFRLLVGGNADYLVVGVVGDVRESLRSTPGMRAYWPHWGYPANIDTVLLKLGKDPGKEFSGMVRRAIYESDPKLIVSRVASISQDMNDTMWAEHYAYRILKLLSLIALSVAVVGLFSVIIVMVDSRRQEFGVRIALGATPETLHRMVLKRGITTVFVGIVVGVVAAFATTRFMQSLLFETTPNDPLVFLIVSFIMMFVSVLACWIPASKAARTDPLLSLRSG